MFTETEEAMDTPEELGRGVARLQITEKGRQAVASPEFYEYLKHYMASLNPQIEPEYEAEFVRGAIVTELAQAMTGYDIAHEFSFNEFCALNEFSAAHAEEIWADCKPVIDALVRDLDPAGFEPDSLSQLFNPFSIN